VTKQPRPFVDPFAAVADIEPLAPAKLDLGQFPPKERHTDVAKARAAAEVGDAQIIKSAPPQRSTPRPSREALAPTSDRREGKASFGARLPTAEFARWEDLRFLNRATLPELLEVALEHLEQLSENGELAALLLNNSVKRRGRST
jgi:hypothetical protein